MLSKTSEYALRAMIYLAQHADDWPIPGRQIAAQARIPTRYLQKILGDLARVKVLDASPGKTGGYRLRLPAAKTKLFDVLAPFERFDDSRCPFGNEVCSDANPCHAHARWKVVVETQQRFLSDMTVVDITDGFGGDSVTGVVPARARKRA